MEGLNRQMLYIYKVVDRIVKFCSNRIQMNGFYPKYKNFTVQMLGMIGTWVCYFLLEKPVCIKFIVGIVGTMIFPYFFEVDLQFQTLKQFCCWFKNEELKRDRRRKILVCWLIYSKFGGSLLSVRLVVEHGAVFNA